MVDTGAGILELDYKVDMPVVKRATAGRTTILGPVDPSGVLALGDPDLVDRKSKEAIEVLGRDGGLILGPGCALPPATPPDNIHALVEAAKKYGVYWYKVTGTYAQAHVRLLRHVSVGFASDAIRT